MQFEQKVFTYDWLAPPSYFECFYFFLQKGRTWRFSVCPFYVRVKLLYTQRCKPAESVTVNFFIGDPSIRVKIGIKRGTWNGMEWNGGMEYGMERKTIKRHLI